MSAIPYESREEEWDSYEDGQRQALPGRPRRRWLTPASAALAALLLGAIGFYVGVRVEKGQLSSSPTAASGLAAGLAFRLAAGAGAAAAGTGTGAGATASAGGAGGFGRFGGGFAAALGGGRNATVGTVATVSGDTIYVTDGSGNTVKVNLVSTTKVSKNVTVARSAIRPGDTVVVQGLKSGATVTAASVADTGPGANNATGGGAAPSGGSSGAAAVNSLFDGG